MVKPSPLEQPDALVSNNGGGGSGGNASPGGYGSGGGGSNEGNGGQGGFGGVNPLSLLLAIAAPLLTPQTIITNSKPS